MISIKEMSERPVRLTEGHRLCAGCAEPIVAKQVLLATDKPVVVANATGCFEVSTSGFPQSAWEVPWIHTAFATTAATISGVESAYISLKRKGRVSEDIRFVAFGGDGATYDIGLQALSGAIERGHRFMYVCLNNEAYMNTGIQRSSSTPSFARTTTTPVGSVQQGKKQNKKDLTEIMVAHGIPYIAQTAPLGNFKDLHSKSYNAIYTEGPCFLNILSPCPRGWDYPMAKLAEITKLAVDTCVWPLFEVEEGVWRLTYTPRKKRPVEDFLRPQGRFRHMFEPGNEWMLEEAQQYVDQKWDRLLERCGA